MSLARNEKSPPCLGNKQILPIVLSSYRQNDKKGNSFSKIYFLFFYDPLQDLLLYSHPCFTDDAPMSVDLSFEKHTLGSRSIHPVGLEIKECLSRYSVYPTGVSTFDRVRRDFEHGSTLHSGIRPEKDIGLIDTELHTLASHSYLPDTIEFDRRAIRSKSEDLE